MKEGLKIGVVCHPTYGGSGAIAAELGLAMTARGHTVHFFSYALPFRLPPSHPGTVFHEVQVPAYPLFKYPPYVLTLATKLVEVCRKEPLDLIHVHYAVPHAVCAYLAKRLLRGGPVPRSITTLHGTDITLVGIDSSFFEITRFSIEESDGVTAVSSQLAGETRELFKVESEVRTIPNFVDTAAFNPSRRSAAERLRFAEPDEPLVGHLSNFREVKRIPDVIRTFHCLQKKVPARLLMIGEGVEVEPARELAADLGIEDRVRFVGAHRDVAGILAQLDLFLLPSQYESFGLAALEAMSCGVPVVATRVGGLPEVVEDGSSGFLCEVGDYRCMGRMAVEILGDPERRRKMGEAARRRAVERFPRSRVVDIYEEYYREILARPPKDV
jgi:N-acetyl-alpha-D-glucosaminyl L-malate synthase BshA